MDITNTHHGISRRPDGRSPLDIYSVYAYIICMDTAKRRKPVTLTIAQDVMAAAKALNLNASQAAEAGIRAAVRESQKQAWLRENSHSIASYNRDVEENGLPLSPLWMKR
jgi:antitoxin CcdA